MTAKEQGLPEALITLIRDGDGVLPVWINPPSHGRPPAKTNFCTIEAAVAYAAAQTPPRSEGVDAALTGPLAQGWRGIESAPRDGSWVLLTDNRCNPCWLIAQWKMDRWWGQRTNSGKSIIWNDATHWMPLPAPPQTGVE